MPDDDDPMDKQNGDAYYVVLFEARRVLFH